MTPSSASGARVAAAMAAGSGTPGPHELADREIEGEDGPGEGRRSGEGDPLAAHLDVERAQPADPVAGSRQRHSVADEDEPSRRLHPFDQPPEPGMDVDAIGDELDEGALIEQGGEREPGRPMVEPRHRVEQVGRAGRAGRIARARLFERRRRVAERDRHPAIVEPADEVRRAGELRGDGDEP